MSRPKDRGFTLVELMVSLTIVALVALALFASVRMAIRAWNQGSARVNASVRMRIGTDLIRKQLACISPVTYQLDVGAGLRGQSVPFFRGDNKKIEFITVSALRFQENAGLVLASYYLDASGGRSALVESERRYLGVDSLQSGFIDPNPIPIVENVDDIQFRFLEKVEQPPLSGNVISEWVDMWDSEVRNELPQAIELLVKVQNFSTRPAAGPMALQELRIVVPVLAKPPAFFGRQMPRPGVGGAGVGGRGLRGPRGQVGVPPPLPGPRGGPK